ncbi:hypothetical protein [Dysgonomonas sp. Marseille-Q5470]|uniref:hypothetical protein n=1 Tax=Dysgonomonas sp. Marseille-Q5470 TaxID=3039494 RepID=UPI0024BCF6ED|nr:hypothetical protein [Dysgonomonas sp. Marseille-Q5470]
MKRLFLSLAILAFTSLTIVSAQEGRRSKRGFSLPQELNLTSEQQQKVDSANNEFRAKISDLRSNSNISKEDRRTKIKELQSKREKEMSMRGKRHDKQRELAIQYKKDLKDLNLTNEQKQQIRAINENYRTKSKELALQHREDLNKIYTPEQQSKLRDIRKDFSKDKTPTYGSRKGIKLDNASVEKLNALKENYIKEKKAIEMSRIAPAAQKQKLSDLRENFRKERRQILADAQKEKANKQNTPA